MSVLKKLLSLALTLGLIQYLPIVDFTNGIAFFFTVVLLSVLFYCIEPILKLFTLPLMIATLGFFRLILAFTSLWLTTFLIPGFIVYPMIFLGFHIHYFLTLIFLSSLIKFINYLFLKFLRP